MSLVVVGLAWAAFGGLDVRADVFYSFDPSSAAGRNLTVNAAVGGQVAVPVFLVFTGADAASLVSEKGLFGSDVQLKRAATVASQPATIAGAADVTANPAFDEPLGALVTYASGADVDLLQTVNASSSAGVLGSVLGTSDRKVLLGSFKFTAGGVTGEQTTYRAADFPGFNDTVTFANHTILDPLIGTADVTISVSSSSNGGGPNGGGGATVPLPPGAIASAGLFVVVLGSWVRTRFRAPHRFSY
jgi:hypothetical protein